MRIEVRLHPGSGDERIHEGDVWEVWVREPARKGKANLALVKAVAKHFSVSSARVRLVRGAASRRKLLEVDI